MKAPARAFSFSLLALALVGCGVKLPPVAPNREPELPPPPRFDCTADDEHCDAEDPSYRPRGR